MLSYKVTVRNPSGLHLRPAGLLCGEAIKYKSSITFQYAGGTANAKSVLSVLGACVKSGDEITLVCEGEDEQAAIDGFVRHLILRLPGPGALEPAGDLLGRPVPPQLG